MTTAAHSERERSLHGIIRAPVPQGVFLENKDKTG